MTAQHIRYRWEYWRRKVLALLGFCPRCFTRMNTTTAGRRICPECGR